MKIATATAAAIVTALLLAGSVSGALACSGSWKQTTAQNQQDPVLPPADTRS